MTLEQSNWEPMAPMVKKSAESDHAKARYHADRAHDAGRRGYVKIDGLGYLFGTGVAAELRAVLDDVTEHAAEAAHWYEQTKTVDDRIQAAMGERIDAYGEELGTTRAMLDGYRQRALLFVWLIEQIDDLLAYIERSAKMGGRRIPPIVRDVRKGLVNVRRVGTIEAAHAPGREEE